MIPHTYKNFFKQLGHGENFQVEFDPVTRSYDDFFKCTLRDAEYIWDHKSGKLNLMFSGGIDSEYMVNAFRHLKMDFEIVIIRLLPNYNDHDVNDALEYCQQHNIKPIIIDLDFNKFVESGRMLDIAKSCGCAWHQIPATLDVISKLDGNVIMACNDPHLFKKEDGTWFLDVLEYQQSIANWFNKNAIDGTPYFMGYSAETFLSFLQETAIVELVNNQRPGKLGTYSSRIDFYSKPWPMKKRQKYTGYEIIEKDSIFQHPNMLQFKTQLQGFNGIYEIEYSSLLKKLKGTL
jgi:hypothetical protein